MIKGLGTDIVDIQRIQKIYEKFGSHFLSKIFTLNELRSSSSQRIDFIAGRWAAKEAASKALGTGFSHGITMLDMEIMNLHSGQPQIHFYKNADHLAQMLGIKTKHISISHDRFNAIAVVILEG